MRRVYLQTDRRVCVRIETPMRDMTNDPHDLCSLPEEASTEAAPNGIFIAEDTSGELFVDNHDPWSTGVIGR